MPRLGVRSPGRGAPLRAPAGFEWIALAAAHTSGENSGELAVFHARAGGDDLAIGAATAGLSTAVPGGGEALRTTKSLLPVDPERLDVRRSDLRGTVCQYVNLYRLHQEFLAAGFPEALPALGECRRSACP